MFSLIEHGAGGAEVNRTWLQGGEAGQLQTMQRMREIARAALGLDDNDVDNVLYLLASQILKDANVGTHDAQGRFEAIHSYVTTNIAYVPDPTGGNEFIEHPHFVLERRYADCDGLALLEAVLLAMVGFEVGFEAAKYHEDADGYEHVYGFAVVNTGDGATGYVYFDPTEYTKPVGWKQTGAIEEIRLSVTDDDASFQLGDLSDIVNTIHDLTPAIQAGIATYAQRRAQGAQQRELGRQFDSIAGQVTQLFDGIQGKPVITENDYNTAAAAVQGLDALAQQYPTDYIVSQWNSAAYKPAFLSRLAQIRARVNSGGAAATGGVSPYVYQAPYNAGGITTETLVTYGGFALVALLAVKLLR